MVYKLPTSTCSRIVFPSRGYVVRKGEKSLAQLYCTYIHLSLTEEGIYEGKIVVFKFFLSQKIS